MKTTQAAMSVLFMGIVCAMAAQAGSEKLSPELKPSNTASRRATENLEVIVQYNVAPTENHHERVRALGGRLNYRMDFIKGAHYTIPVSALSALANDPDVAYVTPNRPLKAMDNITAATVNSVSNGYSLGMTGVGVGIAVIDSGVTEMGDFEDGASWRQVSNRIVYQQSFNGGPVTDQYGHGTHVAGILAGNGSGTVYLGTILEGNIISLKVLDQNGQGSDSAVIQAIQAAISLKNQYKIKVINLSLGRHVYEAAALDPLCIAVEQAWKAGITVVVAAGNGGRDNTDGIDGYGTIAAPGNDPYVITVGCVKDNGTATRSDDLIASYSSKGPTLFDHYVKPDVVAPGNLVTSTLPVGLTLSNEYPANRLGSSNYFVLSGTSMATPIVSGMAAMILQQHPAWTPDQVKAAIMMSATKNNFPTSSVAVDPTTGISYTSHYDIFTIGAGEVDMAGYTEMTAVPPAYSAKSPSVIFNPLFGTVTLQGVGGESAVWGSTAIWGSTAVWGSSAVWGSTTVLPNNAVWGATAVWGSNSMQGFSAVWGNTAVWGSSTTDTAESALLITIGEK